MLYTEYIAKAKDMCLAIDDVNNVAYLLPDYKYMLTLSDLNLEDVTDYPGVTYDDVSENLKLEAEAYNSRHNLVPAIAAWLREAIVDAIAPIAAQDQNELIKNLIDYMKANNERKKVDNEIKSASEAVEGLKGSNIELSTNDDKIIEISSYMNFAKKDK